MHPETRSEVLRSLTAISEMLKSMRHDFNKGTNRLVTTRNPKTHHESPKWADTQQPLQAATDKNNNRDGFKLSPINKCDQCQGYGHVAAVCTTPQKIITQCSQCQGYGHTAVVGTTPLKITTADKQIEYPQLELKEFVYCVDEDDFSDFDDASV